MEEIIGRAKQKGSFEWSWVNERVQKLKRQCKEKDFKEFQPFSSVYEEFQKAVNEHYNASFGATYFEDFDRAVTPLFMSYFKETAFAYQTQQDPHSSFSDSDFLAQCKQYAHCTQQELNIKDKFII